ncbi:hypothetical protein V6Z11_A05G299300 [Gossypium hirsutum]
MIIYKRFLHMNFISISSLVHMLKKFSTATFEKKSEENIIQTKFSFNGLFGSIRGISNTYQSHVTVYLLLSYTYIMNFGYLRNWSLEARGYLTSPGCRRPRFRKIVQKPVPSI